MTTDTNNFHSLWAQLSNWYGRETAWVYGEQCCTYADVARRARRLGSALHRLGMRSQDRAAILAMNSNTYLEVYAACEWTGYITATVNFRLAGAEVHYIVNDAEPKVLFFDAQYTSLLEALREQLPSVKEYICIGGPSPAWATEYETLLSSGEDAGAPLAPPRAQDLAYIIYTSGTTGRPKGCMLDHASQIAGARNVGELLQMSAGSRTLLVMPFYHVGAKALQLAQNRFGGQVHIHREFDIEAIMHTVQREKITNLHLAPVMLQSLIEHPKVREYDLASVRSICYSAAPMPEPVLRKGLELLGPVFVQLWGQTEGIGTVLPALAHRLDGDERDRKHLVSIGHPFAGSHFRIVDDEDRDVPPGQPGEMVLRSSVMMRGYWNKSAATLEALRGGWLHTGDVCIQDDDGYLYLVDRKKDMIISGGENIYSREVEEVLLKHAAVQECAVIGMPHARWGEAVCAVIVKRSGTQVSEEDIVAHCRSLIAGYKRPRFVAFTDGLPRLPSGKISKVELREQFARGTPLREIDG